MQIAEIYSDYLNQKQDLERVSGIQNREEA